MRKAFVGGFVILIAMFVVSVALAVTQYNEVMEVRLPSRTNLHIPTAAECESLSGWTHSPSDGSPGYAYYPVVPMGEYNMLGLECNINSGEVSLKVTAPDNNPYGEGATITTHYSNDPNYAHMYLSYYWNDGSDRWAVLATYEFLPVPNVELYASDYTTLLPETIDVVFYKSSSNERISLRWLKSSNENIYTVNEASLVPPIDSRYQTDFTRMTDYLRSMPLKVSEKGTFSVFDYLHAVGDDEPSATLISDDGSFIPPDKIILSEREKIDSSPTFTAISSDTYRCRIAPNVDMDQRYWEEYVFVSISPTPVIEEISGKPFLSSVIWSWTFEQGQTSSSLREYGRSLDLQEQAQCFDHLQINYFSRSNPVSGSGLEAVFIIHGQRTTIPYIGGSWSISDEARASLGGAEKAAECISYLPDQIAGLKPSVEPYGVLDINDLVFEKGSHNPSSVINLPESLTEIEEEAFAGTYLGTVNVPARIVSIADDAFEEDVYLVFKDSSLEEWANEHHPNYDILDE